MEGTKPGPREMMRAPAPTKVDRDLDLWEHYVVCSLTEAAWTEHVLALATALGWRTAHFRPARTDKGWRTAVSGHGVGFPDLVLARAKPAPGRVLYVELKSERGRLSPEQTFWLKTLAAAGAETYVWRPSDREIVLQLLSWADSVV